MSNNSKVVEYFSYFLISKTACPSFNIIFTSSVFTIVSLTGSTPPYHFLQLFLYHRNYLNDKVEEWDESSVYPQTIVIIDLNNIAYINDNYGHAEGDSVIEQAASILIAEQLENSEIVRTNGNEFLIYMVGFEEKQVITYIRKLSKELKELKHGFGAAIGYSVINDAIKTIDDAINEATTDMRNNKEEANN